MLKDLIRYEKFPLKDRVYYTLNINFSFDNDGWTEDFVIYEDYRMCDHFVTALLIINEMRKYNLYDLNWALFDYLIWGLNLTDITIGERPYGISDFRFEKHTVKDGATYTEQAFLPDLDIAFDKISNEDKMYYGLISADLTKNTFKTENNK